VLDIFHGDFHREPMGMVERIYQFMDLTLSPPVRSAMAQRIEEKPELSHGAHRYALSDFGLSADDIRERFGDYINRFDLAADGNATAGGAH
jgi:hypothetical protein